MGRLRGGEIAFRCTSAPAPLGAGDACAFDVPLGVPLDGVPLDGVPLDDVTRPAFTTSGCGDGLACWGGTCVRPCHLLGCDAGELCPGNWATCIAPIACDPLAQTPCGPTERCAHVTPVGAEAQWICRPAGPGALGEACTQDVDCERALGCGFGRCAARCDATPVVMDGGAEPFPAPCADGARCVDLDADDGAQVGVCDADPLSTCTLADPSSCGPGERCAWGRVEPDGRRFAMRCVGFTGALGVRERCESDVAISLGDGDTLMTSRCGEGLACAPSGRERGICVAPCDVLGCAAGELCPHPGGLCIPDERCVPGAPCSDGRFCGRVVPHGSSAPVYVCAAYGVHGPTCGHDDECADGLGCRAHRCAPLCDPHPDGGATCEDGCVPHGDAGICR